MTYRVIVRAYAKKFPGFIFSDFKAIVLNPTALISIPQYKQLMEDWFADNPDDADAYNKQIAGYEFNDGIAKTQLFIKLNPNISGIRRDFVANGVRSFFSSKTTALVSKAQVT